MNKKCLSNLLIISLAIFINISNTNSQNATNSSSPPPTTTQFKLKPRVNLVKSAATNSTKIAQRSFTSPSSVYIPPYSRPSLSLLFPLANTTRQTFSQNQNGLTTVRSLLPTNYLSLPNLRTFSIFNLHNRFYNSNKALELTIATQPATTTTTTTTTSSTTTTTTTTSTTTTTTTQPPPPIGYINDFKLIEIAYKAELSALEIGYIINTNVSSPLSQILINTEINCTSLNTNQTWHRLIEDQRIAIKTLYLNTTLSPKQTPIAGSLIKCSSRAINLNTTAQTSISSLSLLIEPQPAANLALNSINETCLELSWTNPNYFYDSLEISCELSDDFRLKSKLQPAPTFLNRTISNQTPYLSSLKLTDLTPGANYNCSITTNRVAGGAEMLTSKSKSQSVNQLTKLGQAALMTQKIAAKSINSVEVELAPPLGYYDYFQLDLVNIENRLEPEITQNYTLSSLSDLAYLNLSFIDYSKRKIEPGCVYEVWSTVVRSVGPSVYSEYKQTLKRSAKLVEPFVVKPEHVNNLNSYTQSETEVLAVWSPPALGKFQNYVLSVYELANELASPFYSTQTKQNQFLINNLNKSRTYLLAVQACAKFRIDCDTLSSRANLTFHLNAQYVDDLNIVRLANASGQELLKSYAPDAELNSIRNSTSILLKWGLKSARISELCDISKYRVKYTNLRALASSECWLESHNLLNETELCVSSSHFESAYSNQSLNKQNEVSACPDWLQLNQVECSPIENQLSVDDDDSSRTYFNCWLRLDNLNYNTEYAVSVGALSKNGLHEWPMSPNRTIRTEFTIPFKRISVKSKLATGYIINIVQPIVDQSNGHILSAYLYLVRLNQSAAAASLNETRTFKLNTNDQSYLRNLVELNEYNACASNVTHPMEPCLLREYSRREAQFDSEKYVFIGRTLNTDLNELVENANLTSFLYENITNQIVEPLNSYQLFYIFKIGSDVELKKRRSVESSASYIYFASNPTEPIQTKQLSPSGILASLARDGLALWIIVVISVASSILLISFIVILVVVILTRYKPSKFHKAAQMASQPRVNLGNSLRNNKSSMDKSSDDYLGMSSDFVVPGEFSRHQMTNIWLVKHANADLILDEEYRNLPDYRDKKTCFASDMFKNEYKNRFLDIKAYDDSRVILDVANKKPENLIANSTSQNSVDKSILSSMSTSTSSNNSQYLDSHSSYGDYINANFVQGYSHEKKFIATQGPKKETIVDFWRMVYQYRVSAIVMLTKLVERGVERCTQYWPEKLNITETYGDFEVICSFVFSIL